MLRCPKEKFVWNPQKFFIVFLLCLTASALFLVLRNQSSEPTWSDGDSELSDREFRDDPDFRDDHPSWVDHKQVDKLLGGILKEGLDEKSCRSRYQSAWYHKGLRHQPSPHLISALRSYEALHKRCGPYTESYNKTVEFLKSEEFNSSSVAECKYVVWTPRDGLGNRIITLASTFLYALLTGRVLLVDSRVNVSDLFCEPFPENSWLVPSDFPIIDEFKKFNKSYSMSYGNILKNNLVPNSENGSLIKPYVYLHVVHDYDDDDKRFFCDDDHTFLHEVPWHILKSNIYFAPAFFMMPIFQHELDLLFPEKDTVFYFLGRYLFHPTNMIWKTITRYYNAFLAKADERIGIQVRIFQTEPDPFEHYMEQILDCVITENVLPQINVTLKSRSGHSTNSRKAVLVTSLDSRYYETLKNMSDEYTSATGEIIQVFQPSHEMEQHTERKVHNMKAWAEMYLLSLTDKLITSTKSTFGYVAQGLGGMTPWILYLPQDYKAPDPSCQRAKSMEPCFHFNPDRDCKTRKWIDTGKVLPYVRHCEDMQWLYGLKLFGKDGES